MHPPAKQGRKSLMPVARLARSWIDGTLGALLNNPLAARLDWPETEGYGFIAKGGVACPALLVSRYSSPTRPTPPNMGLGAQA